MRLARRSATRRASRLDVASRTAPVRAPPILWRGSSPRPSCYARPRADPASWGSWLEQVEPAKSRHEVTGVAGGPGRNRAARDVGLSERQRKTALRVAHRAASRGVARSLSPVQWPLERNRCRDSPMPPGSVHRTGGRQALRICYPCATLETRISVSWWTAGGSNPGPPDCEPGALPSELAARRWETEISKGS